MIWLRTRKKPCFRVREFIFSSPDQNLYIFSSKVKMFFCRLKVKCLRHNFRFYRNQNDKVMSEKYLGLGFTRKCLFFSNHPSPFRVRKEIIFFIYFFKSKKYNSFFVFIVCWLSRLTIFLFIKKFIKSRQKMNKYCSNSTREYADP